MKRQNCWRTYFQAIVFGFYVGSRFGTRDRLLHSLDSRGMVLKWYLFDSEVDTLHIYPSVSLCGTSTAGRYYTTFCLGLGIAEITRALKNSFRSFGSVLTSVSYWTPSCYMRTQWMMTCSAETNWSMRDAGTLAICTIHVRLEACVGSRPTHILITHL